MAGVGAAGADCPEGACHAGPSGNRVATLEAPIVTPADHPAIAASASTPGFLALRLIASAVTWIPIPVRQSLRPRQGRSTPGKLAGPTGSGGLLKFACV